MHLKFRNVNDAFSGIVQGIHTGEIPTTVQSSRNGEVLVIEEPVVITYSHPRERVLFNSARDANPFFHLVESIWMLAGRNDLKPLEYYVSTFGQFSDDGKTLNGAYGYRWRRGKNLDDGYDPFEHTKVDQLAILIEHLRRNPFSRRAVLQMWNVEDDLLKIDSSKDVCCNLSVLFSVETGPCLACNGSGVISGRMSGSFPAQENGYGCERCKGLPSEQPRYLNMTVFNRSNDTILGALGANVVHFSILQEYVACCLGLEVGVYNQISNNLHVYTNNWKPEEWLDRYALHKEAQLNDWTAYDSTRYKHIPLVNDPATFDREVQDFIDDPEAYYTEPFLRTVAAPMCLAFRHHKERQYGLALEAMRYVEADDWRIAGTAWIERRKTAYEKKQGAAKV